MIKHISFDFWDTLFIANPNYLEKRVSFLSETYSIDPNICRFAMSDTKRWCDEMSEKTLTCIPPDTQIYFLIQNLGISKVPVSVIKREFFSLLKENPPSCSIVPDWLVDIFGNHDTITTSITCNTGFLGSFELEWVINQSPLKSFFDFWLFSDSIRYFKPNPLIASLILHHGSVQTGLVEEILHVGDNDNTDGELCRRSGMQFLHTEPKNPDFTKILNLLHR